MESILKALGGALTVTFTGFLLYLLGRDAGKPAQRGLMRYGPWLVFVGALACAALLRNGWFFLLAVLTFPVVGIISGISRISCPLIVENNQGVIAAKRRFRLGLLLLVVTPLFFEGASSLLQTAILILGLALLMSAGY